MGSRAKLDAFCKALRRYDHFLLSCHVMPEGDAIGSLLAMDTLLRRLGKKTTVVNEDSFPHRLSVLASKRWKTLKDIKKPPTAFQALVTTDCPTLERIGKVRELLTPDTVIFNIDHHVSNEMFGNYNFVEPNAAACGEVVYDLYKHMRVPIGKDEAKNLYVSIMTDTGSFKYDNTTVRCHRVAADLIATGIDIEKINDEVYTTYSINKIQLYSVLLSRVKIASAGQIAWSYMNREDLKDSGAYYEDSEGFIDFLKYLKEAKVVFFLSEINDNGHVRVSFRTKDKYDANKIAMYFLGGGHKKAAGCVIRSSLQQAEKMILGLLRKKFGFK